MPTNPVTGRNMAPLSEIFGATKNTPRAIFDRSRAENAGTVANHRPNDLALACPRCAAQGNPKSRMFSRPDAGYYCLNSHKWLDWDELMALGPDKLEFKGLTAKQDGWEKLTIEMPGSVLKDLQTKFGERLASTLRSIMDVLTQARYLLIPEEDIKRLQDHTGTEVKNSSQLVGAVYSLKQTNQNLEEANRLMKANRGAARTMSPTAVVVELGDMADRVFQAAADWEQDPGEVVANKIRESIEKDWFIN